MRPALLNAALFQAVWLASVLGAARGVGWAGPAAAAGFAAWQLRRSAAPQAERRALLAALSMGVLADSALHLAGWVVYQSHGPLPDLAPAWILALWAALALTLNESLAWLGGRPALAAGLGAIAGPAAYAAGEGLGAVTLAGPALPVLAAVWALALPLLSAVAQPAGATIWPAPPGHGHHASDKR